MPVILLVEDNINLAKVVASDLNESGFRAVHVACGADALAELSAHHYDAVILDWMLPDLSGLDVLRRLQEAGSNVPVLMLTARADEMDRIIGLEGGADDYLTKPFSMGELIARLRALLRRVEKAQQMLVSDRQGGTDTFHWGDVVIEPQSHRVSINGEEIDLTPIEFALLDLFARNPGRTFNRAYLMETIWQQSYIPGDRSIDNAILRLRRKIYPHGESIEAIWGVGYRLRDKK
jgi:DNA-binding response OmpR family regulator